MLWLTGHLHVNKIQETSPGPSVVNISTLDGGRYNLFDIDGERLRVTTVDPADRQPDRHGTPPN